VIELRDTGRALLNGLKRPTHATFKALSYPVWDMVCLSGSVALAMAIFEPPREDFWHAWFLDLPVWVTPAFSFLAISRTYVTSWTRPRMLDVLLLVLTLQIGLLFSLGLALLIDPANAQQSLLRAFVVAGLGDPAIVFFRLIYRSVEELVIYFRGKSDSKTTVQRILLYGAGGRCQLFLKERGFHDSASFDDRNIVGLIDDEPSLRSQWVYGYLVLGGIKELPQIVNRHHVTGIVVTAALRPEILAVLNHLARERQVHLSEWCFHEDELTPQDLPVKLPVEATI
jgi:FlaA1/EpsC-like NDP-sugar epimerase